MRSLRGNIVRIFIIMSIANTVLLVVLYFVLLNYVTYRISAPISVNRFLPTIIKHYRDGGTDETLYASIEERLQLYDQLSFRPPRVANQDLQLIYPRDVYGDEISLKDFTLQYRIVLPNQRIIYLLPYSQPSQYPTVRTYYPYLFGGIGAGLVLTIIVSAIVGTFFAIQSIKPLEILTKISTSHNILTAKPNQLQQQLPINTTSEINQLAEAIDYRDSEIQNQIMLRRQLNADIAHELRNPLNTIGGYIEAMRDGVLSVSPARLNTMYDEIQALHHLVDDLRLLAQSDSHEISYAFQPIDLYDLIEKAHTIMTPYAKQFNINLINTCMPNGTFINVDVSHMLRVLRNIIDNALRHSNPHSDVTISSTATPEQVTIRISDHGCGIHPEDMAQLFDRYFRARNTKGNGSGLGLPIAQAIVQAHQGNISATSELDSGTIITISLPRYYGSDMQHTSQTD